MSLDRIDDGIESLIGLTRPATFCGNAGPSEASILIDEPE